MATAAGLVTSSSSAAARSTNTTCKAFSSRQSAFLRPSCRCCRAQAQLRSTRSGKLSVVGFGFLKQLGLEKPSWLPSFGGGDKKTKGKNSELLAWARTAKMGTELAPAKVPAGQEVATFAGGCFWGLELAFQRQPGVTHTSVGYTQGKVQSPSYEEVCYGDTGHTEAVQVYYNPAEVSYEELLDLFFQRVDPTTLNRQGNDRGTQYRSGIYFHNEAQKAAAEKAIQEVNQKLAEGSFRRVAGNKVVAELMPATDYWLAESYHQQYLAKGGRGGNAQSAEKGNTDPIRCYG